jgi:predicted ATPase
VLEDLNWADAPSLLLLKFLARGVRTLPVLILATYRDAPIAPELARILGAICREDPKRRIELDRLDLAATSELAKALAGSGVSHDLIEHLWQKSEGNPLFLTQMLHVVAMEEIHAPVSRLTSTLLGPETVREAIAAHLEPLSAGCRDMLTVAAVLGLTFRLDLLARTMRIDPSSLIDLLDEACKAHIVGPLTSATHAFQFQHGVVRDVLYRRLGLAERTRWHRAAGGAIAELYDAGTLTDPMAAAEHWVRGAPSGDVDATIAWLTRTLRACWKSGARDEALSLLEKAFELTGPPFVVSKETIHAFELAISECENGEATDPRLKNISEKFQRRKQADEARTSADPVG